VSGYAELTKTKKTLNESAQGQRRNQSFFPGQSGTFYEQSLQYRNDQTRKRLRFFKPRQVRPVLFIGLFGTVWGIMDTFKESVHAVSATLAVVAPGISEALIATAAGLAAAIPAVIFYNYFLNQSKNMVQEMDNFAAEFLKYCRTISCP